MATEFTPEQTIAEASQLFRDKSGSFRLRISKRPSNGALPLSVATLDGATLDHISTPEAWLPLLAGGGAFMIQVYHESDTAKMVGGALTANVEGTPKAPDLAVIDSPSWTGPRVLVYPKLDSRATRPPSYPVMSTPPAGPESAAPQTPTGRVGGGHFDPGRDSYWQSEVHRRDQALAELQRRIDDTQHKQEEERRRQEDQRERERNQKTVDERMAKLESLLVQRQQPTTSLAETVATLTASLTPLLTAFIAHEKDFKLQSLKVQQEAAMAHAESQKLVMAQMQGQVNSLMARPTIDPAVQALIGKMGEGSGHELVTSMATAMSAMTQNMMQMVTAAAELGLSGQQSESGWVVALREGAKTLQSLMEGYAKAAKPPTKSVKSKSQPQLPAPPLPLLHVVENGSSGRNPWVSNSPPTMVAAPTVATPAVAIPTVAAPAPAPVIPPVIPSTAPNFADLVPSPAPNPLDEIEAAIRMHRSPTEVAKLLLANLSVLDEAAEEAGSINDLVVNKLGGWATENEANARYLAGLFKEVERLGVAAGYIQVGDVQEDDGEEEEDSEGEESEASPET